MDFFEITNRGCVITGTIIEGEIRLGNAIVLNGNTLIKINSVEVITNGSIGLVLGKLDEDQCNTLKKLAGETLIVKS